MKVGYIGGHWSTNIGNSFYNIGAMHILKKVYGKENVTLIPDPPQIYWPSIKNDFDLIAQLELDLIIISGPILGVNLIDVYSDRFEKITRQNCSIGFISAGAVLYSSEEADKVSSFLNKYDIEFVFTRDTKTYNLYKSKLNTNVYDGLCTSMFLNDALIIDRLSEEYIVYNFPYLNEPIINNYGGKWIINNRKLHQSFQKSLFECPIVRLHTRPYIPNIKFIKSNRLVFTRENMYYSDLPYGYLSIIKSSKYVFSDRVHTNAAGLILGSKCMYIERNIRSRDNRKSLFIRLGLEDIFSKPVSLDFDYVESEKNKMISELIKQKNRTTKKLLRSLNESQTRTIDILGTVLSSDISKVATHNKKTPKLSICIPTLNRSKNLNNCLDSIIQSSANYKIDFEVCISDNFSDDDTEAVVKSKFSKIPIVFKRSQTRIGRVKNYLEVTNMAKGEFIWLLGDDDLLLPNALPTLNNLFVENPEVEFFYINSYCVHSDLIKNNKIKLNQKKLLKNTKTFSSYTTDGQLDFLDLINPKVSFDFLGGMFLSVFKKENWDQNLHVLNDIATEDLNEFSHFDNTFPHIKVFANAFKNSKAYFNSQPLSVNLSGIREWSSLSPLVNSIRLVEALEEYKKNGLPLRRYLLYKNTALDNFIPDIVKICIRSGNTGREYINLKKLLFSNILFPNVYLSFFYFLFNRFFKK